MKEIIERFEKETGFDFYTVDLDRCQELYPYDFVDWLIKQLPIHGVVKSLKDKKPLSFQDYKKLNYVHLTNVYACKYTKQIVSYEETLEEYNKYLEGF